MTAKFGLRGPHCGHADGNVHIAQLLSTALAGAGYCATMAKDWRLT
jgi:hypothetical protein